MIECNEDIMGRGKGRWLRNRILNGLGFLREEARKLTLIAVTTEWKREAQGIGILDGRGLEVTLKRTEVGPTVTQGWIGVL